jgi:SOS-response transcriptional repressor LexA
METLGTKLRRHRLRLGLTLDELAGKTAISKPYLSLIETGRVSNPPSDEKLRRLEQTLGFTAGELVTQAHLHRTPRDVRVVLQSLLKKRTEDAGVRAELKVDTQSSVLSTQSLNLDDAYLSGMLHQFVDQHSANIEHVATNSVPIINKVSAGYPKDFTDMSYPKGVADDYVGCPDVRDTDAFAARVHGDSMTPKYQQGDIVIFSPSASCKDGDDCFVRFDDGQTTFKRVFFESTEEGVSTIRLQPRREYQRAIQGSLQVPAGG